MSEDTRERLSITLSKEAKALLEAYARKHSTPISYAVERAVKFACGCDGIVYIEAEDYAVDSGAGGMRP